MVSQKVLQNRLAAQLRKVEQPFTAEFNNALCRLKVSTPVEAIIFRQSATGVEVLLLQRKPDESYPRRWYCPSSIMRPGEKPADVLASTASLELKTAGIRRANLVGIECCQKTRGWFCELIYLVELAGEPSHGQWFPVHNLPLMASNHAEVIAIALLQYRQSVIPPAFS